MEENRLAIFEGTRIRKTIYNNEWWFSIIDVIEVLTDSSIPKRYWSDLKRKLVTEGYSELYEKIIQLKFAAADGKFCATDCANTETMFRVDRNQKKVDQGMAGIYHADQRSCKVQSF